MTQKHKIQLFEEKKVRTVWDDEKEEWFFSIVDVCGVLTDQTTTRGASTYWAVLKKRLLEEEAIDLETFRADLHRMVEKIYAEPYHL